MRTKRTKITAKNYDVLHTTVNAVKKHGKGNGAVREALNLSAGTWSYLQRSDSYENYVDLRNESMEPKPVEAEEPTKIEVVEKVDGLALLTAELAKVNSTLLRMCMAWEATPQKKNWLKK